VVTYTFVMGFVGTGTQSRGIQGQMTYDAYSVTGTTDANITAYIRNTGGLPSHLTVFMLMEAYIHIILQPVLETTVP